MTDVNDTPAAQPDLDPYVQEYERATAVADGGLFVQGDILHTAQTDGADIAELVKRLEKATGQSRRTVMHRLKVAKIFPEGMRHFDWSTHLLMTRGCDARRPETWGAAYARLDEMTTGRLTLADLKTAMKRKDVRELNVLFRGKNADVLSVDGDTVTLRLERDAASRVQPGCTIAVSFYEIVTPIELEAA